MANHSHVCGINLKKELDNLNYIESFPRMWDQQLPPVLVGDDSRIIPTYVGSTGFYEILIGMWPNHSHVCGINKVNLIERDSHVESFPRMWDQRINPLLRCLDPRIIPTYVGSTSQAQTRAAGASNHSHVCGINFVASRKWSAYSESFPRMWDQR